MLVFLLFAVLLSYNLYFQCLYYLFMLLFSVPRCCSKSQQTAISSVMEPGHIHSFIGYHVTILCACVLMTKTGIPSEAILQNVLSALHVST